MVFSMWPMWEELLEDVSAQKVPAGVWGPLQLGV